MENQKQRYSRLVSIPEIGGEGVRKLNASHVLMIGCGALGSMCAMYLAASGVGHLTIADFDTIDISNLQRQLFFTEQDLGRSKAQVLASRINGLNSETEVTVLEKLIRSVYDLGDITAYDVIIDGSDNPHTKLLTDRLSADSDVPCVIAGVRGFECQIMTCVPGSVRYADVFGEDAACSGFTPCSIGGVLGPTAGVAASLQCAEAVKIIAGTGKPLTDRLLAMNLLDMSVNVLSI
jgi:molybdopterin/thiamine biosynthesis adenylyltransferase